MADGPLDMRMSQDGVSAADLVADASEAKASSIFLGGAFGSSVGATCNILMFVATLSGVTIIDNAACEPEIADLCHYLNKCGAKISGIGSPRLTIEGVESLQAVEYSMPQDRIEAATFLMLACLPVGRQLKVEKVDLRQHGALMSILKTLGYEPEIDGQWISISGS